MGECFYSLDTNKKLIWNFWDIGHTMRHIAEGKGSQKRILMILKEAPGITQRELTERLGIEPGSASEVIGKLEASGLILRTVSEADRRTTDIHLTEIEGEVADEAYSQRELRHERMFACLSEQEKQTLLGLLEKVNASWDEQYRNGGEDRQASNYRKGRGRCCRK